MKEIRVGFHDLANKLNTISIEGGSIVEIARLKDIDKMRPKEIKQEFKKALDALSNTINHALEGGEILTNLKKAIYKELDINTNEPL